MSAQTIKAGLNDLSIFSSGRSDSFIPNFGAISNRINDNISLFTEEKHFCYAIRALRIHIDMVPKESAPGSEGKVTYLKTPQRLFPYPNDPGIYIAPNVAYRRLFYDGLFRAWYEIAFVDWVEKKVASAGVEKLSVTAYLKNYFSLKVLVPTGDIKSKEDDLLKDKFRTTELYRAGDRIQDLYIKTTSDASRYNEVNKNGWIRMASPIALAILGKSEKLYIPEGTHLVTTLLNGTFEVYAEKVKISKTISRRCWIVVVNKPGFVSYNSNYKKTLTGQENDMLYKLRLFLFRQHSEICALHALSDNFINFRLNSLDTDSVAFNNLLTYMDDLTRRLACKHRYGIEEHELELLNTLTFGKDYFSDVSFKQVLERIEGFLNKLNKKEREDISAVLKNIKDIHNNISITFNNTQIMDNHEEIHGDKIDISGNVSGTGIAIGHSQVNVSQGVSVAELNALFTPIMQAIESAPAENREEATKTVVALKEELAKDKKADDSRIGKLLDGLAGLVPGAVSAVVSVFATPILGGLAGPVTKFVLDKFRGK